MGSNVPPDDRLRLLVVEVTPYSTRAVIPEAMQYLSDALQLGDPTGVGQEYMADLLIEQGTDPERALDMADKALELITGPSNRSFGNSWSKVFSKYMEAVAWSRKTRALVQLDRKLEARQAMDRALRIAEEADAAAQRTNPQSSLLGRVILGSRLQNMKKLAISEVHWKIGLALLAMKDPIKAAEHLVARDHDPYASIANSLKSSFAALGSWAG